MQKIVFFILLLFTQVAFSQDLNFKPTLNAESAILIDFEDGNILYEKNIDKIVPPASMTKLVTIWTALEECNKKGYDLTTKFIVPESADFRNAPPKSSLMFLQAGQIVTLKDLITGLLIPSGNEAAVALALLACGSTKAFIESMNNLLKNEGFTKSYFYDTSGYNKDNRITVKEFAFFCRKLIKKYPVIIEWASEKSFSFPVLENYAATNSKPVHGTITQYNHNELIGVYENVDGLKTGYITESGNNVALTAKFNDTRFIAVLALIKDENITKRTIKRVSDGSAILTYGFCNWRTFKFVPQSDSFVKIKSSYPKKISVNSSNPIYLTLPINHKDTIELKYTFNNNLQAPINKGSEIGKYELLVNGNVRKSSALLADVDCEYESFFGRIKRKFQ